MTKHKTKPKQTAEQSLPPVTPPDAPVDSEGTGQAETPEVGAGAFVESVEQTVQRLTEEVEQLNERYLRLAAEFDNFKKRTQRERTEVWGRAQADVVANVLDTLDDLGRVAHLDANTTSARDLLAGIELVERKLIRELAGAGLERVGDAGDSFDPNSHEAVMSVAAPSPEQDHQVAAVMQPGYRFGGSLLRPARVSVYVWQEPEAGDGESQDS
jgi:molecular chaperone GrpE